MIVLVASLLFAALLFWFGIIRSHWIAPAAVFAATGPVIAAFSWNHDAMRIGAHLLMNLSLFYVAFACGRWTADYSADRGRMDSLGKADTRHL